MTKRIRRKRVVALLTARRARDADDALGLILHAADNKAYRAEASRRPRALAWAMEWRLGLTVISTLLAAI